MLGSCRWLALEVVDPEAVADFYVEHLDLTLAAERATAVELDAGRTRLALRRPEDPDCGGLHTHYAFAIPDGKYEGWYDRLSGPFDLTEATFGDARSLYFDDPAGNCVELGGTGVAGPGIDGIFEIVLEVADLDRARLFYEDLGFDLVDEGSDRPRVRLTTGELDLELWEPHLGIADGRGGVHVDWGLRVEDHAAVAARAPEETAVEDHGSGSRLTDPDGHTLTLVDAP